MPASTPTRATSPASLIPFLFGSKSDDSQSMWKGKENTDIFSNITRARRSSMHTNHVTKESANRGLDGNALPASASSESGSGGLIDSWCYKPSNDSKPDMLTIKRGRGSILVAASDALGFKFGRKKQPTRQVPMPLILPDVIEISAHRRDEEDRERERLRDMAAQSIGLQVTTKSSVNEDVEEGIDEGRDGPEEEEITPPSRPLINDSPEFSSPTPHSPKGSSHSIAPASPIAVTPNRYRSRSLLMHSRTNSISISPLPLFPTTFNAINQCQQAGTMLYKYYHPSSLRIFALSKNWRHRFMVLSSPGMLLTRHSGPTASYLHIFKSSVGDDIEIERLEINEHSVVFIAEEEVGGRKHVVKVGGVDVGAVKKEFNHEENGRTMWFLHLPDPAEAQNWISVIKNSILGQRSARAGLSPPSNMPGGVEPRGDMDVMLSMQAQGLITPPTSAARSIQSDPPLSQQPERTYASSISSRRSQATVSRSISSGAVSTLKGLFTGSTRPRSASRATSIDSNQDRERDTQEDSFGSMGNHLLGTLRPVNADPTSGTHPISTYTSLPFTGSIMPSEHHLERKITTEQSTQWTTKAPSSTGEHTQVRQDRANKALSLGSLSLQPPPRKRRASNRLARPDADFSERVNDSVPILTEPAVPRKAETEPPSSPILTNFTFGTPEQRPRAPSLQSISTMASGDNHAAERSSSSTKRSSMNRWSRQSVLPRQLSPPAGPPPSAPINQSNNISRGGRLSVELPSNRSRSSSSHSAASQKSFVSSLPSFSKRASGSSVFSTSSLPHSPAVSRPSSNQGHRMSMPPPRPAPTSALPPAPGQDVPKSDPSPSNPSFRESVSHRAFRLSMIAPQPPPSGHLPPRPDEVSPKSHKRNSSAGSHPYSSPLDVIPGSPQPPLALSPSPPFPPPAGPLPPTPVTSQSTKSTFPRPLSRHISFKQRLRILSAPSPVPQPQTDDVLDQTAPLRRPRTSTSSVHPSIVSPPHTPIAEKITLYQDESSFLQLQTPVTPHLPPPRVVPSEVYSEVTSLSPPPRRGSKQITIVGSDAESPSTEEKPAAEGSEHRLTSLSRPGSVISLGIFSV